MSSFVVDETAQRTTYRLRGFGLTYEEITFEATVAGFRATTFLAPNLEPRWYRDFERDRGGVLNACATRVY